MTVKELREQEKLSQEEFAKRIGVSRVTLSRVENGSMKVSPKMAAGVMEAYGVIVESGADGEKAEKKPVLKEAVEKKIAEKKAAKAAKPTAKKPAVKKAPAAPKAARKAEIFVQSPYGGNITPEQILSKIPQDADSCYVRVDQNTIWWVRGEETGAVIIW